MSFVLGLGSLFAGATSRDCLLAADSPKPDVNATEGDNLSGTAAPQKSDFAQAVDDARKAMAARDLAAAKRHVAIASKNAKDQDQLDQVDRLETLLEYLRQFWDGIQTAMAKLNVTDEIVIKGSRVIIVDSSRDVLVVRAAGKNRRYEIATLPVTLVMMLADQCFAKDVDSRVVIGSFLAVDPKGDRATAKKYWQEGAAADIDTEKLISELAFFPMAPADEEPKTKPAAEKTKRTTKSSASR